MMAPGAGVTVPWVIVGLGNPGREHAQSRHNVGFRCVDLLAERHGVRLNDRRKDVVLGQGVLDGRAIVTAKPRTYVNASGRAVRYLAQRFGAGHDKMLVVTDDMDLPMGQFRLRASGGSGGHHGLDSIIAELGTQAVPRLRVGIGRPLAEAVEHVLGPFSRQEEQELAQALARTADAVEAWVVEGVEAAMNRFN